MLKIFNKSATSFSSLGLGILKDYVVNPFSEEILNGAYTFELEYSKDGQLAEELKEENIIVAKEQAFRIFNVTKNTKTIKVLAKPLFFDLANNMLEDVYPQNLSGTNALAWLLSHTQYENSFVVTGTCDNTSSARYVRKNPIDAIYNEDNALLKVFGGELEFDNYDIKLYAQRGSNLGLEIRQGKNVNGVEYNLDFSTVATRLMPIGKDGLMLSNKYVDSSLIDNYYAPLIKLVEVDTDSTEELTSYCNSLYSNGIDMPTISIKIDFIELSKTTEYQQYSSLETAHLGDTCKVYIPSLNINSNVRIVKIRYDYALDRIVELELGSIKPDFVNVDTNKDIQVKNVLKKINPTSILEQAQDNATDLINHPFEGYIYISEDTGELFLMDTNDISTAQSIWKFGLGGIGYSSTGLSGPFTAAITQDGQIVADFITTGTIQAGRIEGYNSLLLKVENDIYTKEETDNLVVTASNGLKNILSQSGGNNILQNTSFKNKTNNQLDYWFGTAEKITYNDAISLTAAKLKNGTLKQSLTLKNGTYAMSLKYVRLLSTASATVKYNGREFELSEADGTINSYGAITTNSFELEINCDTDDGFLIYDVMLNVGSENMPWSQSQNEINTDTVSIGKGITVENGNVDTKCTINADGVRVTNENTNTNVMVTTDKGGIFDDVQANTGTIAGAVFSKINGHTKVVGLGG